MLNYDDTYEPGEAALVRRLSLYKVIRRDGSVLGLRTNLRRAAMLARYLNAAEAMLAKLFVVFSRAELRRRLDALIAFSRGHDVEDPKLCGNVPDRLPLAPNLSGAHIPAAP